MLFHLLVFDFLALRLHFLESTVCNFCVHHLENLLAFDIVSLQEFTLDVETELANLLPDRGKTFNATGPSRVKALPHVALLVLFKEFPIFVLLHVRWDEMLFGIEGFVVKNKVDALVWASLPFFDLE